ncbi:hypothetical protein TNCV_1717991 [Trichonephila clavipes]|nr:hypothetical protein TNCV_1717991 [Trichonephila clavipes]
MDIPFPSNCRWPRFQKRAKIRVVCVMVDHSSLLTTPKDDPANRYTNEILHLKTTLLGFVPLEHLAFCFRGKFCHLAQGKWGLVVGKGTDQQKIFSDLGISTINLQSLPHFHDLDSFGLPNALHDDAHEFNYTD